jgi:hypothetical protein
MMVCQAKLTTKRGECINTHGDRVNFNGAFLQAVSRMSRTGVHCLPIYQRGCANAGLVLP